MYNNWCPTLMVPNKSTRRGKGGGSKRHASCKIEKNDMFTDFLLFIKPKMYMYFVLF